MKKMDRKWTGRFSCALWNGGYKGSHRVPVACGYCTASYQTLAHGAEYQPLPSLMLCLTVCVQSFSQIAMKQKWLLEMRGISRTKPAGANCPCRHRGHHRRICPVGNSYLILISAR